MNKYLTIFLGVIVFTSVNAGVLKSEKQQTETVSKKIDLNKLREPKSQGYSFEPKIFRISSTRSPQNPNVTAVLIDSSVHGYGMVSTATSPVTYVDGKGFVIGYRGWVLEPTSLANNSGFIKSATSEDGGLSFINYSGLNDQIMVPFGDGTTVDDGPLMGRYPSSVGDENYPYVVWTEAINYTGSATNNGGRPMYSYDEALWDYPNQEYIYWPGYYFSVAIDINFGWNDGNEPLNGPGDLWVNCPVLVDNNSAKAMVVSFVQWSSSPDENFPENSSYILRSTSMNYGSYYFGSSPEVLFDINDLRGPGFSSSPTIDINSNGVGYAVSSSYLDSLNTNKQHTLIVRKTIDYGETWSNDGFDNTDFYFIPDTTNFRLFIESEIIPDTVQFYTLTDTTSGDSTWIDTTWTDTVAFLGAFIGYKNEARVDGNGRLHVIADGLAQGDDGSIYYLGGALYHLWSDDPSDPSSWNVSRIVDLSDHMPLPPMPGLVGESNFQIISGNIAISNQNDNVLWVAFHTLGDTSATNYNWDIFITKSTDGGETWSEPENVTMTSGLQEDELYVHLAPAATDTNCFMVYHQPNYAINHLGDLTDIAAFQQNLWFATYGNTITVGIEDEEIIPGSFSLQQNYPNPFNPTTNIAYTVDQAGVVELKLYNVMGQMVKTLVNDEKTPGDYFVDFNASDLASGVYFYKMTQHGQTVTRKLVLMK